MEVGHSSSEICVLLRGDLRFALRHDLGLSFLVGELGFHEDILELFAL